MARRSNTMGDFMTGFQAGTQLGGQINQAMIQRDLLERQKKNDELEMALLQIKTPGLQVAGETKVDGQKAIKALPVQPGTEGDEVTAVAPGVLYNPAVEPRIKAAERAAARADAMSMFREQEGIRNRHDINKLLMQQGYQTQAQRQAAQDRLTEMNVAHANAMAKGDVEAADRYKLEMDAITARLGQTGKKDITITKEMPDGSKLVQKLSAEEGDAMIRDIKANDLRSKIMDLQSKVKPAGFLGFGGKELNAKEKLQLDEYQRQLDALESGPVPAASSPTAAIRQELSPAARQSVGVLAPAPAGRAPSYAPAPVIEAPPAAVPAQEVNEFGRRLDGTPKGTGFLGPIKRPDGSVSTELSIGVDFNGKETLIPSLVPTLSKEEVDHLINGGKPTPQIVQKAVSHARQRMEAGLSPFASNEESPSVAPTVRAAAQEAVAASPVQEAPAVEPAAAPAPAPAAAPAVVRRDRLEAPRRDVLQGASAVEAGKYLAKAATAVPRFIGRNVIKPTMEAVGESVGNAYPGQENVQSARALHEAMLKGGVDVTPLDNAWKKMQGRPVRDPNSPGGQTLAGVNTERGYIDLVNAFADKNAKQLNLGLRQEPTQAEIEAMTPGTMFFLNGQWLKRK